MTRSNAKRTALTKVAKAVVIPPHPLNSRLQKVLEAIDSVHSPKNLKLSRVFFDRRVAGGEFVAHGPLGPYSIYINPGGNHPELSLLHEIGHLLDWQSIPKSVPGNRNFNEAPLFYDWLDAVLDSGNVQRLISLRDQQAAESDTYEDIGYLLRPEELWARAYTQYVARKSGLEALNQQISAENKTALNGILYAPFWPSDQFPPIETTMDVIFQNQGWTK